jgi:hypothetical protein
MEVCCPSGKEIPECDSESIEINDMKEEKVAYVM